MFGWALQVCGGCADEQPHQVPDIVGNNSEGYAEGCVSQYKVWFLQLHRPYIQHAEGSVHGDLRTGEHEDDDGDRLMEFGDE
jgi:hypothetical protein